MKDLILGSHLLFAREGETIDGFVVSPTYKPDADPEANYPKTHIDKPLPSICWPV